MFKVSKNKLDKIEILINSFQKTKNNKKKISTINKFVLLIKSLENEVFDEKVLSEDCKFSKTNQTKVRRIQKDLLINSKEIFALVFEFLEENQKLQKELKSSNKKFLQLSKEFSNSTKQTNKQIEKLSKQIDKLLKKLDP